MGQFQSGHNFGKGRPKGSKNKLNIDVQQKFYYVFENMEEEKTGDEAFLAWGRENIKLFYILFSKLLPKNVDVDVNLRKHENFVDSIAKRELIAEAQAKVLEEKNNNGNGGKLKLLENETQ